MKTREDVATALGITDRHLRYVLFGKKERQHYETFEIPKKSGGSRKISAPPAHLLWLQRKLYGLLVATYRAKACVHGFAPSRSILTNAQGHTGRGAVVNFDLKDFFPSIHVGRVAGIFRNPPYSYGTQAAEVIAQISCMASGDLP